MSMMMAQKVTANHLKRDAYLYVRQSTLHQVFENTESTKRQYALRQRAVALGWPTERVVVIDSDLGHSGASTTDRSGFQRLVAEVSMGHVGIVLGLEVSRLARSSTDWHRLLEICALTDTLILDEDGIYDPNDFNDRLLLGLKGTMSEAELHFLKARMRGGLLNKARRGELKAPLPIGFTYDARDQVALDPDLQVQQAVCALFQTFRRVGSSVATVKSFRDQGLRFPRRWHTGPHKDELVWGELTDSRVLRILHNPRYAGAFCYGRRKTRRTVDGGKQTLKAPREEWHALVLDAHPGYISWEDYEDNLRRLHENAQARGADRRRSPPREGPALLQGLAICGVCGKRMTVRYHARGTHLVPDYLCQRDGIEHAERVCQNIPGSTLDEAIGALLLDSISPLALEVTLTVQNELNARAAEVERLQQQQVERARYEAELAKRRYLRVDPDNRLVADELEADWNAKLRALQEVQEDYERRRQASPLGVGEEQRAAILKIATDFPRLWQDPQVPDRERKRMVRLVLEDVTLLKQETQIVVHIRFKGGATRTLNVPLPLPSWAATKTNTEVVREIDRLLDHHTDGEVARILNERGLRSGKGGAFTGRIVGNIRRSYGLQARFTKLRAAGMLTANELAAQLGVEAGTVRAWRRHGLLQAEVVNDKGDCLYAPLGDDPLAKSQGEKLSERRRFPIPTTR